MTKTMASSSDALPSTLPLRVVTEDCAAEEKRSASPLGEEEDDDSAWDAAPTASPHQCSPTSDDEWSALIPTTAELEPLDDPTPSTVQLAIQTLSTHDDWLQQHEAITVLRQSVVRHTRLLSDAHVLSLVPALVVAGDNLRSALAKNALLALAECCQWLGLARLARFLAHQPAPLVDVLLRRAVCEKKFLRDAALDAVGRLIEHLASPALVAAAAGYAASKSGKVVAIASKVMAQSFARLRALRRWDAEQFVVAGGGGDGEAGGVDARCVLSALAKFRAGKDGGARAESMACLRLLGESLGRDRFAEALRAALGEQQTHTVASVVAEVFPPAEAPATQSRRGSLRDRMQQQQQQTTTMTSS